MEKEFVPYEQALALKELGFDEPCFGYYLCSFLKDNFQIKFGITNKNLLKYDKDNKNRVSAPLYQQAFRWFREKYKLSCFIELIDNSKHYYFDFTICDSKNRDWDDINCFDSCKRIYDDQKFGKYEEAELECLKKLIEIVKNK